MSNTQAKKTNFANYTVTKGATKSKLNIPKETCLRTLEIDISDETYRPTIIIKHRGIDIEINTSDILMYKDDKRTIIKEGFEKLVDDDVDDVSSTIGSPASNTRSDYAYMCTGYSDCGSISDSSSSSKSSSTKTVKKTKKSSTSSTKSDDSFDLSSLSKSSSASSASSSTQDKKDGFKESKMFNPVYGSINKKDLRPRPKVSKSSLNAQPCYIAIVDDSEIVNVSSNGDVTQICTVKNLHSAFMIHDNNHVCDHIAIRTFEKSVVYGTYDLHYLQYDSGATRFHNFEPSIKGVLDGREYTEIPKLKKVTKKSDCSFEYKKTLYEISQ